MACGAEVLRVEDVRRMDLCPTDPVHQVRHYKKQSGQTINNVLAKH